MERKDYLLSELPIEPRPITVRAGRIPAVSAGVTIRFDEAEIDKFIAAKSRMRG